MWIQQECLIFINQRQHEITLQSQKALHEFFTARSTLCDSSSYKYKTSMQAETQNKSPKLGTQSQIDYKLDYQSEQQRELEPKPADAQDLQRKLAFITKV